MRPDADRHRLDLTCGAALLVVSAIDFYTARSLSLVAYVQPDLVGLVQWIETGLSTLALVGVAAIVISWPLLVRDAHRRLILAVLALQTLGLSLDVLGLLASTLFGHRANPIYLLLEAALVHASNVLLFAVWYATLDQHRQVANTRGGAVRQRFAFPQHTARLPGYEGWVPGFVDYLSLAFSTSSSLGPAEAIPVAKPAKLLTVLQLSFSLVILLVLAARAIGLIV